MKQCWPEGDLRASVDGELPQDVQERLGEHLAGCAECRQHYEALSSRAVRVSNLMAILPAPAPAPRMVLPMLPARVHHGRRWAVAALSLAAALAVAVVVVPKHASRPVPEVHLSPAAPTPVELPLAATHTVAAHRAIRHTAVRPAVMRADFLRLDDEPLETGTVVRVSAENGDIQADLIVGPDGRAHAIRVIGNQ